MKTLAELLRQEAAQLSFRVLQAAARQRGPMTMAEAQLFGLAAKRLRAQAETSLCHPSSIRPGTRVGV